MKRIDFRIYDELAEQINEVVKKYGFSGRTEFFKYTAIEFLRKEGNNATISQSENDSKYIKSHKGLNLF